MAEKEVRLIDANNAHDVLMNIGNHLAEAGNLEMASSVYYAAEVIENQTTIDPESLRPHGKWLPEAHKESTNYRWNVTVECSNCCDKQKEIWAGFFPNVPDWLARDIALDSAASVKLSNYCPNCGAKMDKEA